MPRRRAWRPPSPGARRGYSSAQRRLDQVGDAPSKASGSWTNGYATLFASYGLTGRANDLGAAGKQFLFDMTERTLTVTMTQRFFDALDASVAFRQSSYNASRTGRPNTA